MYGNSVMFSLRIRRLFCLRCYSKGNSLLDVLAKMPKAKPNSSDGHRVKANMKKTHTYPPSNVYLQVVGSGARGAPNALYLFTDHNRYLFNCGEASQRVALEHKVKVSRLDHIFITNKTWRNLGGLPGLSITLQQVGLNEITVHGPDGLDLLYNATKGFVVMKEMTVNIAKCNPTEDYEDSAINIKYVLLQPQEDCLKDVPSPKRPKLSPNHEFEEFINDKTDYYHAERVHGRRKSPPSPRNSNKDSLDLKNRIKLEDSQDNKCTVAYVCTLKKRLGTLQLEKCVELGIKPGPLLGRLKNGEDVILPNGKIVMSKDVKTPDDPGPVFIVLEVPELSYLKESQFNMHFDTDTNSPENIPVLIVHFTPFHVFNTPEYKSFMSKFGPSTQHLVMNELNSCLGSEAVHKMQHKLHLLDPDIFPLLKDISIPPIWKDMPKPDDGNPAGVRELEELKNKIALAQFQSIVNLENSQREKIPEFKNDNLKIISGRTLTMFYLRPGKKLDRSVEPKLLIQDYIQETMDVPGFVDSLEKYKMLAETVRSGLMEYPKVLFLGTGSSMPGKTRNVSAFAVYIRENHSMLLDCGEGTFTQIMRYFGLKKANDFLRGLKAVYISHLHADHHIGLLGILQARRRAFAELGSNPDPLYLLAPGQIMAWLTVYDKYFEPILEDFTLVPNQNLVNDTSEILTGPMLVHMGLKDVKTCYVAHCPNAFGVALYTMDDKKITYSGDTIPCEELAQLGKNSTLLIHEATMEDELSHDARQKMHSTTSQAIEMGRKMAAKYTILTHFSQRYARIPRMVNLTNNNVGIAYDNMEVSLSDLDVLPHMHAPLQLIFAEHCEEIEQRAANRQRQMDRKLSPSNSGTNLPQSTQI